MSAEGCEPMVCKVYRMIVTSQKNTVATCKQAGWKFLINRDKQFMASLINKEIRSKGKFFIIHVLVFFMYLMLKKDEKKPCLLSIKNYQP